MKKTLGVLVTGLAFAVMANAEIQLLTAEEAPVNYTQDGKLTGIGVDVVEGLKKATGESATIEIMPWIRVYDTALKTPGVLVFSVAKTKERVDAGFQFIGPVVTRKHTLYKKKGDPLTLANIEDVKTKNLTVGSVRGTMRAKLLTDMGIKVDEVTSHTQNLKKLQAGRIPLVAMSDLELKTALDIAGLSTTEFEPALVFSESGSFLAFSKGTPKDVVEKWQKAYADLQKGDFFVKTARKWSSAVEAEVLFSPEKGLFIK